MHSEVWPRKDAERTLAARASGFGCLSPGVRCASAAGARKGACALLCEVNQVDRWIDGQPYVRCGIDSMADIDGLADIDGIYGIDGDGRMSWDALEHDTLHRYLPIRNPATHRYRRHRCARLGHGDEATQRTHNNYFKVTKVGEFDRSGDACVMRVRCAPPSLAVGGAVLAGANTRSCAHAQRGLAAKGRGADASGQGERVRLSVAWRALRQRSWRSEGLAPQAPPKQLPKAAAGACALLCEVNQVDRWIDGSMASHMCDMADIADLAALMAAVDDLADLADSDGLADNDGLADTADLADNDGLAGIDGIDGDGRMSWDAVERMNATARTTSTLR